MIRELRNYLAGQVVGLTRDEALLDELLKCAFCRASIQRDGTDTSSLSDNDIATVYHARLAEMRNELYLLDLGQDLQLGGGHIAKVDRDLAQLDLLDPHRDIVADIYQAFVGNAFRGQEGQFFTPKNAVQALVAMVNPASSDVVLDPACGAGGFLLEAARFALARGESLPGLSGIDKDGYLVKLARIHVALQFGATPAVVCADSLGPIAALEKSLGRSAGEHDVVLTNPPFGAKIVAVAQERRAEFELAFRWRKVESNGRYERSSTLISNPPPQTLFLERCVALLREGGRLGIVLPESTLSSPSHRGMVQYILDNLTPIAVVGMPEALFKTSGKGGTHAKVCLVVAEKRPVEPRDRVFMAEAAWCGHDSRGVQIDRDDLPDIVERYSAFKAGDPLEQGPTGFSTQVSDLRRHVLAPRYYDPVPAKQLARIAKSHDHVLLGDLIRSGGLAVTTGDEVGKLAYGGGPVPFVRTSDLSNWEIKVDPKHCVSEGLYADLAPRQDVAEGDVLMVRDGTYLIGTCAMVTAHDVRIVFQSHLYKLRLAQDAEIDRYLLLAGLSSPLVQRQIRACSFTQDIINTLGDRITEIVIPVPKAARRRKEISALVERVIADRVEARELARRASIEITADV